MTDSTQSPDAPAAGTFSTEEEARAWIAHYNANRCPCGGAPLWVERGYHAVEWHNQHGWPTPPGVDQ